MNILQILPELNVGGVETGTVDFSKYLVNHGHNSIVVSAGGRLVKQIEEHGAKHYTLPVNKKNIFVMIKLVAKLVAIIEKEKVDIVHARSRVPAWIAFFACRCSRAIFITTCHGYYSKHFFSRAMGWGKFVIAISEVIGQHMVQDFKISSHFIRVIPRSVDTARFNIPRVQRQADAPKVITMLGRITPLKGHPFFLKAMAQVVREYPHVKIQIIGDAPAKRKGYKDELLLLTKRLGLSKHVEFMGNRHDIPQLLSNTDCLVLSTITQEAFGRVILEAQAAGVPVVATKVGGVSEIIDHEKTGLLVAPRDVEAMAKAVLRILKDPVFAETLVGFAKRKIEDRYTLKHMAESTLAVYREALRSLNILVIKLSAIGDVVLVTASLKALRQRFPDSQIYVLTSPQASQIIQRCPYINSVIVFDDSHKGAVSTWQMGRILSSYRFDKVVDFQNNRLSHLLSFLTNAKDRYGYRNRKWGFLLNRGIKNDLIHISPVEHQFRVLKPLGIDFHTDNLLELWPSPKDYEYAQELLDSEWMGTYKDIVGLNVAASSLWLTKNWPQEHIIKLCDLLAAKNIRVVLTGEKKDQLLARHILARAKSKPVNFIGKTNLMQLAALISRCRVYVSPDSAPLHIAAAMKVPVIGLFGPTDPVRHMPPTINGYEFHHELKCSPCYSGSCRFKTNQCMRDITPEQVVKKIMSLIE